MLVRTDDEVYRVDAVWLGPPRATFPWRARYVSYALGLFTMVVVMFVQRRIGIELDFFSVAWSLVLTVVITRFIGKRVNYDRPLGQIVALFRHEVTGPREQTAVRGGIVRTGRVAVRQSAPISVSRRRKGRRGSAEPTASRTASPRTASRPAKPTRPVPAKTGLQKKSPPKKAGLQKPSLQKTSSSPIVRDDVRPGPEPASLQTPDGTARISPDAPRTSLDKALRTNPGKGRGGRRLVGRAPVPPAPPVRTVADHVNGARGGPA